VVRPRAASETIELAVAVRADRLEHRVGVRQPHKNLFMSYRGSRDAGDDAEIGFDRQLEDNATKALIYVLEHADPSVVLRPFLSEIAGVAASVPLSDVQFALQRADIRRPLVRTRIALSIAPIKKADRTTTGAASSGRPDAWMWADGVFALLLETKVRGRPNDAQIRRHINGAEGWTLANTNRQERSWSEIYEFLQRVRASSRRMDPATKLLLEEIVGYLRMLGLSSTTTFDLDDFGYFLLPIADRDAVQRSFLKRKLTAFSEEFASAHSVRRFLRKYAGAKSQPKHFVHPGTFRADAKNFWITLGRKERRHHCHMTVRLSEHGIALEAFSPHKSFTRSFVRKIAADPAGFVAALRPLKLSEPFAIQLREAHYSEPGGHYKGQRIRRVVDFLQVHPAMLRTDEIVTHMIVRPMTVRMNKRNFRPEIRVIRQFDLSKVVGKPDVVDLLAATAEQLLPYLRFALDG
jgi:hypothetical protein